MESAKHMDSRRKGPSQKVFYYARLLWAKSMLWGASLGCHQLPERSFHFRGYQFPVCARCTGTFLGELLCLAGFFAFGLLLPLWAALDCAAVMLLDWVANQLRWYNGSNAWRFITGVLGGLGCWSVLVAACLAIFF